MRRAGFAPQSASFKLKADALAWSRKCEADLDRGLGQPLRNSDEKLTLTAIITRYAREVASLKRGADQELQRLRVFAKHPIAQIDVSKITAAMIVSYRDKRLETVAGATVRRELALLRHVFEVAMKEWGLCLSNPVKMVRLPPPAKSRDRRLAASEWPAFWSAAEKSKAKWWKPFLIIAIETGMRRSELLALQWSEVDMTRNVAHLRHTKNGLDRSVPLTPSALRTLEALRDGRGDCPQVFAVNANAVHQAWLRQVARAGLRNFRLHDLRHEAVSRFFEMGLTSAEVALISGHRDPRMLARYTHLRPEAVASKLQRIAEPQLISSELTSPPRLHKSL